MKRPLAPVQPPAGPSASARTRQAHPLLSAFPLTLITLGALLMLFAVTMTLGADADGAVHASTSTSVVARGPASSAVPIRVLTRHVSV
jgi:hypothetical protein